MKPKPLFTRRSSDVSSASSASLGALDDLKGVDDYVLEQHVQSEEKSEKRKQLQIQQKMLEVMQQLQVVQNMDGPDDAKIDQYRVLQDMYDGLKMDQRQLKQRRKERERLDEELELRRAEAILAINEEKKARAREEYKKQLEFKVQQQRKQRKEEKKREARIERRLGTSYGGRPETTSTRRTTTSASGRSLRPRPPPRARSARNEPDPFEFGELGPMEADDADAPEPVPPAGAAPATGIDGAEAGADGAQAGDDQPVERTEELDAAMREVQKLGLHSQSAAQALAESRLRTKKAVTTERKRQAAKDSKATYQSAQGEDKLYLPALDIKLVAQTGTENRKRHVAVAQKQARKAKNAEKVWLMYQSAVSRKQVAQDLLAANPPAEYAMLQESHVGRYFGDEMLRS